MKPIITAFRASPDGGQGLARDMRVRWALEEVGQPYDVRLRLVRRDEGARASARCIRSGRSRPTRKAISPCSRSGAIVLPHRRASCRACCRTDANARARAITWMFAALSTVEPPIVELAKPPMLLERDKPWYEARLPIARGARPRPAGRTFRRLGDADWLDGGFSAGDLMMVTVLRRLAASGLLDEYPNLAAYVARGEARPAFKRAFADQLAVAAEDGTGAEGRGAADLPEDVARPCAVDQHTWLAEAVVTVDPA